LNKPKIIGTRAETAVVRFMRSAGFPQAERRALRGTLDAGDVTGCPGLAVSIKGGQQAKAASDGLIATWLGELMTQVANAGADVGLLVVARAGIGEANAGRWWAVMPGWQYEQLCNPVNRVTAAGAIGRWCFGDRGPIRQHLTQACALLVYAGYGSREVVA
jgi:hypothetical protein